MTDQAQRLGHCTPPLGGHSPACIRDGSYCSMASSHDGPCKPHGKPDHSDDHIQVISSDPRAKSLTLKVIGDWGRANEEES